MKKRIISVAAVLLLMLSIMPAALADTAYPAPDNIEAGTEIDHLVAIVTSGTEVFATKETLPDGVELELDPQSDGLYVYLKGIPTNVGTYNCVINVVGSGTLICPVTVIPSKPRVSISSPISCQLNDLAQLNITATITDSGSLSYQWYKNSRNDNSTGTSISNATGASYTADTTVAGTMYYYCIVTNYNSGESSSVISPSVAVTVSDTAVSSISINSLPSKTSYFVGDKLDTSGLSITANFSNGSSSVLSSGFSVSPTQLNTAGSQLIEVSYKEQRCSFSVEVEQKDELITGIGVLKLPVKTKYEVGDQLDASGLIIRAYTENGYYDVTTELLCSPTELYTKGTQTITVRYKDKSCTFSVEVSQQAKPASLAVASMPSKSSYLVGESLDTSGLSLTLTDSDGKTEIIDSGFTCSPTKLETVGRQEIVVTYGDLSCRFNVSVAEDDDSKVSPSPDVSPSASPAVSPAPDDDADSTMNSTWLVVIVVVALLALLGLGAYVFITNRGKLEDILQKLKEIFHKR